MFSLYTLNPHQASLSPVSGLENLTIGPSKLSDSRQSIVKSLQERPSSLVLLTEEGDLIEYRDGQPHRLEIESKVKQTVCTRYCCFAVDVYGRVLVEGIDAIDIGVLGLGKSAKQTGKQFRQVLDDEVVHLSACDSYAVALTRNNDIYIWGTTLDAFFG